MTTLGPTSRNAASVRSSYSPAARALAAFCAFLIAGPALAQDTPADLSVDELAELSLEQLLSLETPAALTGRLRAPASVTTITAEDIRLTPARNIYDLLEVYVPGAVWMNHHEGPSLGLRGIITDRNNKFLLLLNGRNMNQKAHNGALSELDNWDLGDIEKIQIIRGPGSVTYGPGAVSGVINIVTKSYTAAKTTAMARLLTHYTSGGAHLTHARKIGNAELFLYGSVTRTAGHLPRAFIGDSQNELVGYVGQDFALGSFKSPAQEYFRDYNNEPQLKLHAQMKLGEDWKAWGRYTSSGATLNGAWSKVQMENQGPYVNLLQRRVRHVTLFAERQHHFSDDLKLRGSLSFDSTDNEKGNLTPYRDPKTNSTRFASVPDPFHPVNRYLDFREDELFAQTVLNWKFAKKYEAAFGAEYSYEFFGPGWGDGRERLRMGDGRDIASGLDSLALPDLGSGYFADKPDPATFVGNGWATHTVSLFTELNLEFHEKLAVLGSARLDKNTFSPFLFSPRLALSSDWGKYGSLQLIGQQSLRINTASQLLQQVRAGGRSAPERITGLELIYEQKPIERLTLTSAAFFNDLQVIAWNEDTLSSAYVGSLRVAGLEVEGKYEGERVTTGLSHSYTRQLSWKLAENTFGSGISYADYRRDLSNGGFLSGYGNNLNNWSNHATKLYGRYKYPTSYGDFIAHMDLRVFWAFEGARDGLVAIEEAVRGTDSEDETAAALDRLRKENAYGTDLRVNAALSYSYRQLTVTAWVQNLLGLNGAKRYSYDAGMFTPFPHRAAWVEEPRTFELRLEYAF